jgi:collagenase-like PrtC family protease
MAGLDFSVPYNDDPETLEEVFRLKRVGNNRIREVFLSGPQEYSGSGRVTSKLSLDEFIKVVDKIHKEGLRVNLVMNPICEGSNWYSSEVLNTRMEYLRLVHKEHGVEAVTIANPVYMKEVRRQFPDIEICASVLSDIDSVRRAIIFKEFGANTITPDANINRNLKLLKEIKKATGVELKIMVNEGCLYKCPFRKFHFNYISHESIEGKTEGHSYSFPANCCLPITVIDTSQVLKSCWIRPEDTSKYNEVTSYFKVVGREAPRSRALRSIKAYMEEDWNGDLLDIMCSSLYHFSLRYGAYLDNKKLEEFNFFEKVTSCGINCSQCDYCAELAKRLLMLGWLTPEKLRDFGCDELAYRLEMGEKGLKASRHGSSRMLLPHFLPESSVGKLGKPPS